MGMKSRLEEQVTPRLAVSLGSLKLTNPLIPASGCYGFGYERAEDIAPDFFGSIALREPRASRALVIPCRALQRAQAEC